VETPHRDCRHWSTTYVFVCCRIVLQIVPVETCFFVHPHLFILWVFLQLPGYIKMIEFVNSLKAVMSVVAVLLSGL